MKATVIAVVIGVGVAMAGAGSASAATLTVNTSTDSPIVGDGACSLREAIAAVDSPPGTGDCGAAGGGNNTIVVPAGHYVLTVPGASAGDSTGDLNIAGASASVSIIGAGAASTTIDATGLGDRVLSVASPSPTTTLRDLTLTGGHAPDGAAGNPGRPGGTGGDGQFGGGIDNRGALTLDHVDVINNQAGSGGRGGTATAPGNSAAGGGTGGTGELGGGVYNQGTLTVLSSLVAGNRGGDGGAGTDALFGPGGSNADLRGGNGGTANGDGGGIDNAGGVVTIRDSTIIGNRGGNGGAGGAGVQVGMSAGDGGNGGDGAWGGGINNLAGTLTIVDSTIADNAAGNGGIGGAGADSGVQVGATGAGGGPGNGGGIRNSGTATLVNVTVAENVAGTAGDAITVGAGNGILSFSPVATTLQNSIVVLNGHADCSGPVVDGGHDITTAASGCPGEVADPRLGLLQDNGGPTPTFALGASSPAIDRIPAAGSGCPATDQRGVARPQGSACDIGAYEYVSPVVVTPPGGTPGTGPPVITTPPAPIAAAPVLSALKLSPARFRAAHKGGPTTPSAKKPRTGTTITYRDSVAAVTTLTITRSMKGAKIGKKCRARTSKTLRKAKRCTLVTTLGQFTHADRARTTATVHFSGRLSRKTLKAGTYSLVVAAKLGTRTGRPLSARFSVKK